MMTNKLFNYYRVSTNEKYIMTKVCSFINSNAKYHGDTDTKINLNELKECIDTNNDNVLLLVKCNNTTNDPFKCILITNDESLKSTTNKIPKFDILLCMVFSSGALPSFEQQPLTFIKHYIELKGNYITLNHLELRNEFFNIWISDILKSVDPIMVLYSSLVSDSPYPYINNTNYFNTIYNYISYVKYSNRSYRDRKNKYYIEDEPVTLPKEYNSLLLEFIKSQNMAINSHKYSRILRNTIPAFPTMKSPFYAITYKNEPIGYMSVIMMTDTYKTKAIIDCILFKPNIDIYTQDSNKLAMALKRWARSKNIKEIQYSSIVTSKDDDVNRILHLRNSNILGLINSQYRYITILKSETY